MRKDRFHRRPSLIMTEHRVLYLLVSLLNSLTISFFLWRLFCFHISGQKMETSLQLWSHYNCWVFKWSCAYDKPWSVSKLHKCLSYLSHKIAVKSAGSGLRLPSVKTWFHCLPAVWPMVNYFTSPNFHLTISKMEIIIEGTWDHICT